MTPQPKHVHQAETTVLLENGRIEVCECGATRETPRGQEPRPEWHTCALCTHPWGRS